MVGGIKASSPGMMSMSADMFLDLPTMLAPSGEERSERVQPHTSSALGYASAALQRRTAGCTVRAPLKRRRLKPQG